MFKRIDHVELMPTDTERTIDFYENVLGFKMKEQHEINRPPLRRVVFMTLGDTMIEFLDVDPLGPECPSPWTPGFKSIALEVENMDVAIAYLKSKGVEIAVEPVDVGGGSLRGEIRDPDGFTIELRQW